MLHVMTHRPRSNFDRLVPVSDRYATLAVEAAFTWDECAADVDPGEWYMVAFRSIRRAEVDETRLMTHDEWAHSEAMGAVGFVHYFKGPTQPDGRCMSFCLWDSRAEARAAAGRPAHREAAALTHEAYAEYTLEFHRVRRLDAGGFSFEPYDAARTSLLIEPEPPRPLMSRLAPS